MSDEFQAWRRRLMETYRALPLEHRDHLDDQARRAATVELGEPTVDPRSWAHDFQACEFSRAREKALLHAVSALNLEPPEAIRARAPIPTPNELRAYAESLPMPKRIDLAPLTAPPGPTVAVASPTAAAAQPAAKPERDPWDF